MKTQYTVGLAMLAGFGLGAVAVQGLHAQTKPPVYYVAEIDVANADGYAKEYSPKARAIILAAGGRFLVAGARPVGFDGEPPKPRVVILQWESMEKIQAWRNSEEFKEHAPVGQKYAKFRSFAVEGAAP